MPKLKSHKGVLKRVRVTAHGKVKHKRCGTSHLNSSFTGQRIRDLRQALVCDKTIAKKLERVLHRRLRGRDQD